MTSYGTKELTASFRTVRKNTITIAEEIVEQHYGFTAAPEMGRDWPDKPTFLPSEITLVNTASHYRQSLRIDCNAGT